MRDRGVKNIFIFSIILKVGILIILSISTGYEYSGYHNDFIESDDVRYITGALYYSEHAEKIYDPDVFTIAFELLNDRTGYASEFSLWYWFVCIFIYVFESVFTFRIVNILIATLTAYYLFKLTKIIFSEQVAKLTAVFYLFNPYFVVFPLYVYKDQLVSLFFVQIFYHLYDYYERGTRINLLKVIAGLIFFSYLRSGFSLILAFAVIISIVVKEKKYLKLTDSRAILSALAAIIVVLLLSPNFVNSNIDSIFTKFSSYVLERQITQSSTITFFLLDDFTDIYKLPMVYVFAWLQPTNLTGQITTISSFIGTINVFGVFLAVGNCFAILDSQIRRLNFTIIVYALFTITLVTSLGIARHYYFILPMYVMFLAAHVTKHDNFVRVLIFSTPLFVLILAYYIIKVLS